MVELPERLDKITLSEMTMSTSQQTPSPSEQCIVYILTGIITKWNCWSDIHIEARVGWSHVNILVAWLCVVKHHTAGCWIPHHCWCTPYCVWPWLSAETSFSKLQTDAPSCSNILSIRQSSNWCLCSRNPEWSWYYRLIVHDRSRHHMPEVWLPCRRYFPCHLLVRGLSA